MLKVKWKRSSFKMNAKNIINTLAMSDIDLYLDDNNQLKAKAPKGAITSELRDLIKNNKAILVDYLIQLAEMYSEQTEGDQIKAFDRPTGKAKVSFAQQRLWFIDNLQSGSPEYNMPMAFDVKGTLDSTLLNAVFSTIIERHEVLRTVYLKEDGQILQQVQNMAEANFSIQQEDLTHLTDETQDHAIQALIDADITTPFDLESDLMLRVCYLKKTEQSGVLLFNMHHIASDGWSVEVLTKEFLTLYHAYYLNQDNPLPALDIQYADYAQWQREYLEGEVLEKQLGYWEKQLDEVPAVHSLPLDHARPVNKQQAASVVRGTLPSHIAKQLMSVAQDYQLTPFMLLHGALSLLLSRHSNTHDIVIGTPVANRLQTQLEPLIGFFVNTLVLRASTEHNSLTDFFSHIKQVHLDAQSNQDVPFEQLIDHIKVPRSKAYNPLFQIMMTTSTSYGIDGENGIDSFQLPNVELSANASDLIQVKFDLDIDLNISDEGVGLRWTYDVSLFTEQHIKELNEHLCTLLTGLSQTPSTQSPQTVPMLSAAQTRHLIHDLNDNEMNYSTGKCIHELFEHQAQENPDNIAVVFEDQQLTYKQLNEKANQLAHYIHANHSITPDTFIGLCAERSVEMVIGILGILKAGGAYVPLDPDYPQSRLNYMLEDAQLNLVLCQSQVQDVLSDFQGTIVPLDNLGEVAAAHVTHVFTQYSKENMLPSTINLTASNLAYVIYTSGSTGQPKGVMIEHESLVYSTECRYETYTEFTSFLLISSMSFDSSVAGIFSTLCGGAKLCLLSTHSKGDTSYIVNQLKAHEISHLLMVPSFYDLILNEVDSTTLPALKGAIVAGESCSKNVVEKHYQKFANQQVVLFNEYGPTEATVWSTVASLNCRDDVSIGKALPGKSLFVMHNNMLVPYGGIGELHIGGNGLARGYLNRPDLTAERFITNPFYDENTTNSSTHLYKTGDLVRYLPDGNLEFIGRSDDQVKVRGFRIELGEVEAQLEKLALVNSALVTTHKVAGSQQLVGYVKAQHDTKTDQRDILVADIKMALGKQLPDYMVPSFIILVDEWPLTANGKMDKNALPHPGDVVRNEVFVSAKNDIEKTLMAIWCELLELEKVSTNSNFFEMGGNSLLSITLQKVIQERLDLEVELTDIFEYPTIHSLSQFLSDDCAAEEEALPPKSARTVELGNTDIAVIGMAGRFPGADNVDKFWENIRSGEESIQFFSDEELKAAGVDPLVLQDPHYVKSMDVLDNIADFDAKHFDFTPREAELLDPQHRLMLEVASDALEHSGYGDRSQPKDVGVFVGVTDSAYLIENLISNPDVVGGAAQSLVSSTSAGFLATKLSYKLNLTGPSLNVLSACSSSLVNVHQACNSLLLNECDMALAGGARLASLKPDGYSYVEGGVNSSDGHCRPFDVNASGTRGGSGGCVLLLKRLDKALADQDTIHAVIKGTAVNNDAAQKVGYMAPSISGQTAVIKKAMDNANVDAESIQYLEAHGTGTKIGDPIEVKALQKAYKTPQKSYCALGSVKANIGHLDVAAGTAGMIKVVEAMKNKLIPPSINFTQSNTQINFEKTPFYINKDLKTWECEENAVRRAGISSFGIGGTNAHVIMEQAPEVAPSTSPRDTWLIPISAQSPTAVKTACHNLVHHLEQQTERSVSMHDIAYTLQVGRTQYEYSTHVSCQSIEDAISQLKDNPKVVKNEGDNRSIIFMFPGQGAQYVDMAKQLYINEPTFKAQFDQCAQHLALLSGESLEAIIYPSENGSVTTDMAQTLLNQTHITQPALFTIEYSLAKLLQSWGIEPDAMIGHSIGEYVAACLAGVFTLDDALKLVSARGQLMQQAAPGSMLSISMAAEHLRPLLVMTGTCMAGVNSANNCVASGSKEDLTHLEKLLDERNISYRPLHTSHAFHSKMMDVILDEFLQVIKGVTLHAPIMRYVSNLTGQFITAEQAQDPHYWANHLRGTVLFADGIETILSDDEDLCSAKVMIEVGPGRSLSTLARKSAQAREHVIVPTTRHPNESTCDVVSLQDTIGKLWSNGINVNWDAFNLGQRGRRVPLPTYPFEKTRYWIEAGSVLPTTRVNNPNAKLPSDMWWSVPTWKQKAAVKQGKMQLDTALKSWLLIMDTEGVAEQLSAHLHALGHTVVCAYPGDTFSYLGENNYTFDMSQEAEHYTLLDAVNARTPLTRLVHLTSISSGAQNPSDDMDSFWSTQQSGALSALYFMKAIVKADLSTDIAVDCITNEIESVTGEELINPGQATITSLCKVAPQEYPDLSCRHIDIQLQPHRGDTYLTRLGKRLSTELMSIQRSTTAALRGSQYWEKQYEQTHIAADAPAAHTLKDNGVYLITGGLGNIGLLLAGYISKTVSNPKLVLVGRSEFPQRSEWSGLIQSQPESKVCERINQIQQIESRGAQVSVMAADSAELTQMEAVFNAVERDFGKVNGIIHAAGQLHGSMTALVETTVQDFEQQYSSKVAGVMVLDKLLRNRNVDFCLLMSSLSSVLGGLGFSAYAAANIYMDAFVQNKHIEEDERWISVNWDGWDFSGEAANNIGFSMTPEEGETAFSQLLSMSYYPQLVHSTGALDSRLKQWVDKAPSESQQTLYERPELDSDYVEPSNEIEQKLVAIWQDVLGIEQIGIEDNFFDLGGDSLVVTRVISEVRKTFSVGESVVSISEFFEQPVIKHLAKKVAIELEDTQVESKKAQLLEAGKAVEEGTF